MDFLLILVVGAVLYALWVVLQFIFDLIDQHARAQRGGRGPQRERETSESR